MSIWTQICGKGQKKESRKEGKAEQGTMCELLARLLSAIFCYPIRLPLPLRRLLFPFLRLFLYFPLLIFV